MRHSVLLLAGFVVLLALMAGQSQAVIEAESVIGVWLFDSGDGNVARDSSRNGNNGEIKGDVAWIEGQFSSSALQFPGKDGSFVLIPHNDSFNLVTFTMTAWLKGVVTGKRQEIIIKRKSEGPSSQNFHIQIESGFTGIDVNFTVNNRREASLFGKTNATDGEWYHVTATYDGKALRLYVNGELDGEMPRNATPDTNDAPLTMGAGGETGDSPFTGTLDDVGLFDVALAQDDIKEIMAKGLKEILFELPVSPSGKLISIWGHIKSGQN